MRPLCSAMQKLLTKKYNLDNLNIDLSCIRKYNMQDKLKDNS